MQGPVGNYHWADIRVWDGIKLLELELIVGANVDVGAPILSRVAVPRSREDLTRSVVIYATSFSMEHLPVIHLPSC